MRQQRVIIQHKQTWPQITYQGIVWACILWMVFYQAWQNLPAE